MGGHGRGGGGEGARGKAGAASLRVEAYLGALALDSGVGSLREGQILRLDRLAGDVVELRVAGETIGWGKVIVVEDHYGIRIQDLRREPA